MSGSVQATAMETRMDIETPREAMQLFPRPSLIYSSEKISGEKQAEKLWSDAMAWFEENRGLIVSVISRLEAFVPYDREDFLQEAKLVVFEAWWL